MENNINKLPTPVELEALQTLALEQRLAKEKKQYEEQIKYVRILINNAMLDEKNYIVVTNNTYNRSISKILIKELESQGWYVKYYKWYGDQYYIRWSSDKPHWWMFWK